MIAWMWVNRGLSGAVLIAVLIAAASVYVMSLRSSNAELAAGLAAAEARAASAVAGAERIRLQADALIASKDAAAAEYSDALNRIRRAADACLDQPLPGALLDKGERRRRVEIFRAGGAGIEKALLGREDSMKKESGMGMGWKVSAMLALALAGCGQKMRDEMLPPPLEIRCPDPDGRARLVAGATYRDLAKSRSEAVSGWRQCHDALAIAQDR